MNVLFWYCGLAGALRGLLSMAFSGTYWAVAQSAGTEDTTWQYEKTIDNDTIVIDFV